MDTDFHQYDRERDACGIGAVVNIDGRRDHRTVSDALRIVERLDHRAGKDAEGAVGDGVGILTQLPHEFFAARFTEDGLPPAAPGDYAVGMFFFPRSPRLRAAAVKAFEVTAEKEGLAVSGWRTVPVRPEILGRRAAETMPFVMQCRVLRPSALPAGLPFERRLYLVRRQFEKSCADTYVASLSSRTVVYKGMLLVKQLGEFYPDLADETFTTAMAMVHSRFSTNTEPSWHRAHPNRLIAHNGEINTIRGNADRMLAREETMHTDAFGDDMEKILPVIDATGSDSAILDNTLEFLCMCGIDLPLAVMMTIPEPWKNDLSADTAKRDFYHYYATMMEPWDGPAAVMFCDGTVFGAVLDRNGLRPARYVVTDDNRLILSSETGVLDLPPERIVAKDRLRPGRMLLADTARGRLVSDEEIKARYAGRHPYGEWLDRSLVRLKDLPIPNRQIPGETQENRDRMYKFFGWTYEDVKDGVLPMAEKGEEAIASMGADIPLAALSHRHPPLSHYFKQLFAQVTNPPIDALREKIVTDTTVYVGSDGNLLSDAPDNCAVLEIEHPVLTGVDLMKIRALDRPHLKAETVSLLYYKNTPLSEAVEALKVRCDRAYRNGANILILSDRGVDENRLAIPSLLAVSGMEQHLIRTKKRTAVSIILESAEPHDVHQFALLFGYGARAVHPYLAHECVAELVEKGMLDKDVHTAIEDYNAAVLKGIVKIAAKMGISAVQSYQSAQIFEAVGLGKELIDRYFTNTVSRVGGIGMERLDEDVIYRHALAFDPLRLGTDPTLDSVGFHKLRSGRDKEDHMYSPAAIVTLQRAVREGDYERFREYAAIIDDENAPHTLRGLLSFKQADGIPLDEVESEDEIVRRFKTGAMSYGSISQEAHECLAVAMNRLGGKSNSGEGGERPERFGTEKNSAIKQVASGRFGVTAEYLASAKEIQIKMAQGAKPGEGGHLPGRKVYPWIARTRCSTPGVALISPPPHHDIYSIEDLAQLIYDLKCANRDARISVKLVSEAGVGTIASGVAKAGAQVILISGYDGGTGAAPMSSIHYAGLPWELGLAEAHRTLIKSGLRTRVVLETDGKLMTGRDVAVAALLGAEEFGFATAPLVAMGCMMMRVCNLDTCPFGVATQNETLRRRFSGKPEYVMNFMRFVARGLREIMARLGFRTVDEMVGRTDMLTVRAGADARGLDLAEVLNPTLSHAEGRTFDPARAYDFRLDETADTKLIKAFAPSLKSGRPRTVSVKVENTDRTFGTLLGAEVTRRFGHSAADDTFTVVCSGSGGQSFGAFLPVGVTISLAGDANDSFGKGLSGGRLALFPPAGSHFKAEDNVIVGNVALYGATSGAAYMSGRAGERFCVRNSGAEAVCEGCGDHGLEYMTGGRVAVLGKTGKNFAAGMSGGVAYVFDPDHDLYRRLNKGMADMEELTPGPAADELKAIIGRHVAATGSPLGQRILSDFEAYIPQFKRIVPRDYRAMTAAIAAYKEQGFSEDDAELKAFRDLGTKEERHG